MHKYYTQRRPVRDWWQHSVSISEDAFEGHAQAMTRGGGGVRRCAASLEVERMPHKRAEHGHWCYKLQPPQTLSFWVASIAY